MIIVIFIIKLCILFSSDISLSVFYDHAGHGFTLTVHLFIVFGSSGSLETLT